MWMKCNPNRRSANPIPCGMSQHAGHPPVCDPLQSQARLVPVVGPGIGPGHGVVERAPQQMLGQGQEDAAQRRTSAQSPAYHTHTLVSSASSRGKDELECSEDP
jgi:hypothetical protein